MLARTPQRLLLTESVPLMSSRCAGAEGALISDVETYTFSTGSTEANWRRRQPSFSRPSKH